MVRPLHTSWDAGSAKPGPTTYLDAARTRALSDRAGDLRRSQPSVTAAIQIIHRTPPREVTTASEAPAVEDWFGPSACGAQLLPHDFRAPLNTLRPGYSNPPVAREPNDEKHALSAKSPSRFTRRSQRSLRLRGARRRSGRRRGSRPVPRWSARLHHATRRALCGHHGPRLSRIDFREAPCSAIGTPLCPPPEARPASDRLRGLTESGKRGSSPTLSEKVTPERHAMHGTGY